MEMAETAPETSMLEDIPEPEQAQPETADLEPSELPDAVTSTAEDAVPLPAPPEVPAAPVPASPVQEAKKNPKPKPTPKAAPKPAPTAQAAAEGGAGGGTLSGEASPGGGQGPGRGGVGGGTGIGNPNALNAYAAKIRAKLNRYKKYPPAAAANKIGGVTTMVFTVNREGQVISSRMSKGSGQPMLDEEAMALVKRCSPFPPIPPELTQATITLTVPISFSPPRI
jgi:protein TonB